MTRSPGIALAITGADCLPIILSAPGMVAVVHLWGELGEMTADQLGRR